jgi:hypothetical protein
LNGYRQLISFSVNKPSQNPVPMKLVTGCLKIHDSKHGNLVQEELFGVMEFVCSFPRNHSPLLIVAKSIAGAGKTVLA